MASKWLEERGGELGAAIAKRLSSRAASVFVAIGEPGCLTHAAATLKALAADLASGKAEALRRAAQGLVAELEPRGLRFTDLRIFLAAVREVVLAALAEAPEVAAARPAIDAWFLELSQVFALRFVVEREAALQERAARLEVKRLESQLAELKAALAEKSELLERVRQTSTPIAPVVDGILVVPLVGAVDTFRTELLTERLLQEVARTRAQGVILDVSGVPVFDTEAARLVVRLARAVRLLGTEMILVGVAPATARTIVELGLDLGSLRVLGTLQDGLALALQLRKLKIVPL
ncbi:MAG TPA: STAS domain-containing protein [Nannocystis sp.]